MMIVTGTERGFLDSFRICVEMLYGQLIIFSIFFSVLRLSWGDFIFACLKYCLLLAFDFGVFTLIVFAIEPKKTLDLSAIDLLSFIIVSFIVKLRGCTLFVFLTSIISFIPLHVLHNVYLFSWRYV